DGFEQMEGYARPFGALHLGDEVFAVLAQSGALGRHIDRVEELLHDASSSASVVSSIRIAQVFTERAPMRGWQRSNSDQFRHRPARYSAGGVCSVLKISASSRAVCSVSARNSASNA